MREPFDIDEFVHFASQPGATAPYVKEAMGLQYSESYVNRLMKRYVGRPRPTHASVSRPNKLREAAVAYMEAHGLDKRYCSVCGVHRVRECAIRALRPELDSFVFVCVQTCAAAGDF